MDKILKAADDIAAVFNVTQEWLDPDRSAVVKILKQLVKEKFTSTNTDSPKLLALFDRLRNYKYHGGDPEFTRVINEIREQLRVGDWRRERCTP